jgi:hypothetical protein
MSPGDRWSSEEVLATVDSYFALYDAYLAGEDINKRAAYRSLAQRFPARSEKAFERKFQNVSACLEALHLPWLRGLLPARNFQGLLLDVVAERINGRVAPLRSLAASERPERAPEFSEGVFVEAPTLTAVPWSDLGHRVVGMVDFAGIESRNRALGRSGEEWVVDVERKRLRSYGRDDLAERVQHVSVEIGDGLGFDVRSFSPRTGAELAIEVKTTRAGASVPFFVTRNEVDVSRERPDAYRIYRVHCFGSRARIFELPGAIDQSCDLAASVFRARPRAMLADAG